MTEQEAIEHTIEHARKVAEDKRADADEFKKQIAGMAIINNYSPEKANNLCKLIDEQPTAYDVDKVMEVSDGTNCTTTLIDNVTECCGYDFGVDNEKVNYCPVCGKRIINRC